MRTKHYIITFFIFLTILMVYAPAAKILEFYGITEPVNLGNTVLPEHTYSDFPGAEILNKAEQLKADINNIYLNYMPLYSSIIYSSSEISDSLNAPIYKLYEKSRTPNPVSDKTDTAVLENTENENNAEVSSESETSENSNEISVSSRFLRQSDTHRYYLIEATLENGEKVSFLDTALVADDKVLRNKLKSQLKQINRIATANDDVNFYFFMESRFQDMEIFETCVPDEKSTHSYFEEFLNGLDERVKYEYIDINSIEDRIEKIFLTDHHWTAYGSYDGYCQIINMMREDSPEIIEPRPIGIPVNFENSRFYGSYSRGASYSKCYDEFIAYDYQLPEYRSFPEYKFDTYRKLFEKESYNSPSYDLYSMFYPQVHRYKYPENNTGRNLLIIGDSFAQGFSSLIASSFDTTYIYYCNTYPGIDYNKVIESYDITDVLFMQFSDRIMFDTYRDDNLALIKTNPPKSDSGEDN